MEIHTRAKVT